MSGRTSLVAQRRVWTIAVGLLSAAFWIVALGVGLRAWLVLGSRPGIVGHATEFGQKAAPYMITASVLTATTAIMGVGAAVVRHLVDGPVEVLEPKEQREPVPTLPGKAGTEADTPGFGEDIGDEDEPAPGDPEIEAAVADSDAPASSDLGRD